MLCHLKIRTGEGRDGRFVSDSENVLCRVRVCDFFFFPVCTFPFCVGDAARREGGRDAGTRRGEKSRREEEGMCTIGREAEE